MVIGQAQVIIVVLATTPCGNWYSLASQRFQLEIRARRMRGCPFITQLRQDEKREKREENEFLRGVRITKWMLSVTSCACLHGDYQLNGR